MAKRLFQHMLFGSPFFTRGTLLTSRVIMRRRRPSHWRGSHTVLFWIRWTVFFIYWTGHAVCGFGIRLKGTGGFIFRYKTCFHACFDIFWWMGCGRVRFRIGTGGCGTYGWMRSGTGRSTRPSGRKGRGFIWSMWATAVNGCSGPPFEINLTMTECLTQYSMYKYVYSI